MLAKVRRSRARVFSRHWEFRNWAGPDRQLDGPFKLHNKNFVKRILKRFRMHDRDRSVCHSEVNNS